MKERLNYIDTLRVLACFLVILTHSAMPATDPKDGIWMFFYSFISSPSSELFLALSGAVLLPVNKSMKDFYVRRFKKLLPPVFIWSFIIMIIYVLTNKWDLYSGISSISLVFVKPVVGVYWFIYVIIGLYLLAPIISKWLIDASQKQVEFFLLLWLFNLIMPYFNLLIPDFYQQSGTHYWMLNYFGGFLGYWLLGYYLRRYPFQWGINRKMFIVIILFILYSIFILWMKLHDNDVSMYTDNLQIGSALGVILIFTFIQCYNFKLGRIQKLISEVAKYSFGIYLVHILVARELVWHVFENFRFTPLLETPIIALFSLILSFLLLYFYRNYLLVNILQE